MWRDLEGSGSDPIAGFTLRARKVLQLANQEAHRLNHPHVAVEHLLLGLVKDQSGLVSRVLHDRGCSLHTGRAEVAKTALAATEYGTRGVLAWSAEVREVVQRAAGEAARLGHSRPGTGHILLALLDVASVAIARLWVEADPADLRSRVLAGFAEADWALAEEFPYGQGSGPWPLSGEGGTRVVRFREFSLIVGGGFIGSALGTAFGALVALLFPDFVALVCRTDSAGPIVSLGAGMGMVFGLPLGAAAMAVGRHVEAVRRYTEAVRWWTGIRDGVRGTAEPIAAPDRPGG